MGPMKILPPLRPAASARPSFVDPEHSKALGKGPTPASNTSLPNAVDEFTPGATAGTKVSPSDIPPADWTCFVHLNADNNLESDGIANLKQMEQVGSLQGKMNVIALVDGGTGRGATGWTAGTRLLWIIKNPSDPSQITSREIEVDPSSDLGKLLAQGKGELDMGSPEVLHAAVDYVQQAVPSQHFMLDLWDHGNDWHGISYDDDSGDHLDMPGLEKALSGLSKKVDIVSTDACLMATDEVADTVKADGVDWLVGSEEVEPDSGWNYADFLGRVSKLFDQSGSGDVGADQVAKAIRDSYLSVDPKNDVQMSAIDLSKLDGLNAGIEAFSEAILAAGGLNANKALRSAYEDAQRFDDQDMIDLGDFARRVSQVSTGALKTAADQLLAAVQDASNGAVATGAPSYDDTTGMTIYAPKWGGIESAYSKAGSAWLGSKWNDVINTYPL